MTNFSIGDDGRPLEEASVQDSEQVVNYQKAVVREAHELFLTVFGVTDLGLLRAGVAPGRVNLIGEHVDYCDGFVLPMAIPLYTAAVGRAHPGRGFSTVYSSFFNESVVLKRPYDQDKEKYPQWTHYVQGVMALYSKTVDMDFVVHSHIPPGSSLSSSAALELSVLYLCMQFVQPEDILSVKEAALLCQKAEHTYANVPCGIMDQLVIAAAEPQKALKIDCLTLEYEPIPMSIAHDVIFLVTNSGVRHSLASSEYAKRRLDVEKAVKLMGVSSWRDVSHDLFHTRSPSLVEGQMLARATHVFDEIGRTVEAANALLDNNIILFGKLMIQSHDSLKEKYHVSCPELDALVEIAMSMEGVFGSRMTGGGFGGCTVTMVRRDQVENLKEEIRKRYKGGQVSFVNAEPVGGARFFPLETLFSD